MYANREVAAQAAPSQGLSIKLWKKEKRHPAMLVSHPVMLAWEFS